MVESVSETEPNEPVARQSGIGRRAFLGGAGAAGLVSTTAHPRLTGTANAEPNGERGSAGVSAVSSSIEPTQTPFTTSSDSLTRAANVFWTVYGLAEGGSAAPGSLWGANCAWTEWDAMQFAWTAYGGYRTQSMETLLALPINGSDGVSGEQPAGFPWSWADREAWPDGNDYHDGVPSYHFDQVPRFVNATYAFFLWTRDEEFLARALPRAELIMERFAMPVLGLDRGLLTIPDEANDGVSDQSRPSTYMDQLRSGYEDAWINAAAYTALIAMADLERIVGDSAKAARYEGLSNAFAARYDEAFWNPSTGRYAGWRDVNGSQHDSGYLHANLEAFGRGLGGPAKADTLFTGIAEPAERIAFGPHTGSTDTYHNVVAARTTTLAPPAEDMDAWSDPIQGPKPYGDTVQSGGTVLWLNYYDVMARLRYQDADRAFVRFRAMLDRIVTDSHLLTFDAPGRLYNDFGESLVQLGSNQPFPESGIAVLPLIEGFAGVRATPDGLTVAPDLPSELVSLGVADVNFAGRDLSVTISRAEVVAAADSSASPQDLAPGAAIPREFDAATPFNQVQAQVGATHGGWAILSLERRSGEEWVAVASRRHEHLSERPTWLDLAAPMQEPGHYRLIVQRPGSDGPLPHPEGEGGGGVRLWAHRVLNASQESATPGSAGGGTVALRTGANRFTVVLRQQIDGPVTATLQRRLEGRWVTVATQVLLAAGDASLVFATSDQKPGQYRVTVAREGKAVGVALTALERAVYTVESPELDIRTKVPAGEAYVLAQPPGAN